MAEQDSFIQEVTEEVRKDRMFAVWKKYGPIAIGAVVTLIAGTLAYDWWNSRLDGQKAELGSEMIAAADLEDPHESAEAFLSVADSGEFGYPALARLRAAAAFSAAGDAERAAETYAQLRDDEQADTRLRDLAELRSIMLTFETTSPEDVLARLAPLASPGSPWRSTALEYEAAAHIRAGDNEAALDALDRLTADTSLPTAAIIRAREMRVALAGLAAGVAGENDAETPEASEDTDPESDQTETEQ